MIPRRLHVTRYMIHVIIHSNYFAVSDWLHQFDGKFAWRHKFKPSAPSMLKKGSRLSENEKAELLTNNERKKCRNTQNISLDVIYFLRYLQGKLTSVIPCREVGKSLEERLRGVSLLKKLQNILLEYFKFLKN